MAITSYKEYGVAYTNLWCNCSINSEGYRKCQGGKRVAREIVI